ncbi:MAG: iron-containing alcohol dehydrogenase [Chitinophagaceae bacterium]|nr:MAG: iron-containing alcohol dehydrogenase [Chitinophagaceae bacterium]
MMEPHILLGEQALLADLPGLVRKRGCRRLLLAAGPHFLRSDDGRALISNLGTLIAVCREAPPGLLQLAEMKAISAALPTDIDGIIAVGGGRSIDFAKALLFFKNRKPDFFAAVPTTAGSGSDATSFAVVYDGIEKHSLAHPALLPNVVVWQESLLDGLPLKQRAISGLDALVQCLESLWSLRATAASRALAWEAGNWLWKHLPAFVHQPGEELTLGALYAAHYSGRAINQSRTTGPHALSYYLTAVHGIDHGHAVAMLFPVFLRYNDAVGSEGFDAVLQLLGEADAESAVRRWQLFVESLGLESRLSEINLPQVVQDEWMEHVNAERFANNPAPFDPARLKELLQTTLFA